jgi:protein-L-isoaspartate(D-aspartate) O-methyltransferase
MTLDDGQAAESLAVFVMELRARGIRDTLLLSACERAPRERFLKPQLQRFAYQNVELPIGCGQSAPSPFEIVRRLAALAPRPRDMILEIGAGSGFQTALLGFCARRVVALERYRTLALEASRRLTELGIGNASVRQGDGRDGMPTYGPYDAILINCGLESPSELLLQQLAPGGRVLAPLGRPGEERWTLLRPHNIESAPVDLGPAAVLSIAAGSAGIL